MYKARIFSICKPEIFHSQMQKFTIYAACARAARTFYKIPQRPISQYFVAVVNTLTSVLSCGSIQTSQVSPALSKNPYSAYVPIRGLNPAANTRGPVSEFVICIFPYLAPFAGSMATFTLPLPSHVVVTVVRLEVGEVWQLTPLSTETGWHFAAATKLVWRRRVEKKCIFMAIWESAMGNLVRR